MVNIKHCHHNTLHTYPEEQGHYNILPTYSEKHGHFQIFTNLPPIQKSVTTITYPNTITEFQKRVHLPSICFALFSIFLLFLWEKEVNCNINCKKVSLLWINTKQKRIFFLLSGRKIYVRQSKGLESIPAINIWS